MLAGAIGMPPGMTLWKWPAEPFSDGLPGNLAGSLELRAMRATLTPNLTARELRTTLRVDRDELALEDFSASVAGGRLTGRLTFKETAQGLSTQGQLVLANADVTTFLPDATRPPITGRLGLDVYIEGTGRSPQALLGSLQGAGSVTLGNAEFAALDPRAFATVTRAVDQGQPIEAPRIQSFTTNALTSGRLSVRELKGDITISAGQVRLANVRAKGEGADVTIGGALDLTNGTIDSRIVLTGAEQVSSDSARYFPVAARPAGVGGAQHRRIRADELAHLACGRAAVEDARGDRAAAGSRCSAARCGASHCSAAFAAVTAAGLTSQRSSACSGAAKRSASSTRGTGGSARASSAARGSGTAAADRHHAGRHYETSTAAAGRAPLARRDNAEARTGGSLTTNCRHRGSCRFQRRGRSAWCGAVWRSLSGFSRTALQG